MIWYIIITLCCLILNPFVIKWANQVLPTHEKITITGFLGAILSSFIPIINVSVTVGIFGVYIYYLVNSKSHVPKFIVELKKFLNIE